MPMSTKSVCDMDRYRYACRACNQMENDQMTRRLHYRPTTKSIFFPSVFVSTQIHKQNVSNTKNMDEKFKFVENE